MGKEYHLSFFSPLPARDDLLNSDFHVMLVDRNDTGNTSSSGRLQITYRGLNMSMCGLLFTESVAEVLCRQLGFARMVEFCTNSWQVTQSDSCIIIWK